MGYYNKIVECGNMVFTFKYYAVRERGKRSKGRAASTAETSEGQKRINQRISERRRVWNVCSNFSKGDYWITLTYRKGERPVSLEDAHGNLKKLIRKLRDKYKKRGIKIIYMGKTELGTRGGLHHHLLIKAAPGIIDCIVDHWTYGGINTKRVYSDNVYQLGSYYAKQEEGTAATKYIASRNLKKPKITIKRAKAETFRRDPKEKKNCIRIHLYNNVIQGYEYQEYFYWRN